MIRKLLHGVMRLVLISFILSGIFVSYASAQEKILQIDTDASCITSDCHGTMGRQKYVHTIGVDGKLCIKCHRITEKGRHRFEKISAVTRPLCAQCHSKIETLPDIKGSPPKVIVEDKDLMSHKPFAEGKCTECHDAHESNYYKHLKEDYPEDFYVYYSRESYALCFNNKCHRDIERAFTEPRTLTDTLFRNGNLNLHFFHSARENLQLHMKKQKPVAVALQPVTSTPSMIGMTLLRTE
jgi:predicted CXXCH cytochrome family protein